MAFAAVDRAMGLPLHQLLELGDQALVAFAVVRRVTQNDSAVLVEGDPVIRIGEVFRCEPEIQLMLRHQV